MPRPRRGRAGTRHPARSGTGLPPGVLLLTGLLPIAFVLADSLVAVAAGPGLRWASMLAAAPALAAARYGPRGVLATGAVSLAICLGLGTRPGSPSGPDQAAVLAALALVTATSAVLSGLRLRRERELVAVRTVAEAAQKAILPPVPPRVGPLRTAVHYTAAAAEASIGGDVYAAVETPHGPRALIADVRGKGLPAIGTAALVLAVFREAAHDEPDLLTVVERLENSLRRSLPTDDDFVTATVVALPSPDRLDIVNCGHEPPLLIRGGAVTALPSPRPVPPLGLLTIAAVRPRVQTAAFRPGDQLLLYTDGITEARDSRGRFFPLTDHLAASLTADPRATLARLRQRLGDHTCGRLQDDIALLLLQHTPSPAHARERR
ncbi:PP2C family protein-serine/threonine phosphatase [Streptomyces rubiginosohelvolus]|uniref:PP2C family protein-serine/threonine phosphatase n=1 Tax=Streptomyces rubiginosohelvolus TaxID=67362 RepID=UPI00365DCBD2